MELLETFGKDVVEALEVLFSKEEVLSNLNSIGGNKVPRSDDFTIAF